MCVCVCVPMERRKGRRPEEWKGGVLLVDSIGKLGGTTIILLGIGHKTTGTHTHTRTGRLVALGDDDSCEGIFRFGGMEHSFKSL